MNIQRIKLSGTYLSESISVLPSKCLIDKGITGCGGTTVELQSKRNSIILCPTRNLVTSKSSLGYFGVDGKVKKTEILNYIKKDIPYKKIVATYDALPKLMETIPNYNEYFLLIDEYHLLFNDYSFRDKAILFILKNFKKFNNWCFLTATPLKDEFILEELKDIDRVIYEWKNSSLVNMHITDTYYVQKELLNYINILKNKNLHIFLNSITTIRQIIKNISEDSYRVVCSENSKTKIQNFCKITDPIKKINFYTSCAFEGCDVYDPNGITIVVCDTNISTTVLDIATKIRQVCGRLRDSKYKNECYLILNTSKHRYAGTSELEFLKEVEKSEKLGRERERLINGFTELGYESELRTYNKENYSNIYLNRFENKIFFDPNLKKLDIYNYKLISEIYNSKISVIGEFENNNIITIKQPKSEVKYDWIKLDKNDYTYNELEEKFSPVFEQHGLKWNKNNSIKNYFPTHIKKQKRNGTKKEIHYIFNIF